MSILPVGLVVHKDSFTTVVSGGPDSTSHSCRIPPWIASGAKEL